MRLLQPRPRHLCGHAIKPEPDCLATRRLAELREEPCQRCRLLTCHGPMADLVLGHFEGDRFIEDRQRTLADDSRVVVCTTSTTTTEKDGVIRLCIPRLFYPHSIAFRHVVEGQGVQYEVIYRSR